MKFFITGHTGFKGAWLSVMLSELGHEIHGYALDPEPDSLYRVADVASLYTSDTRSDIRDREALTAAMVRVNPDVVIHLAAQALVRQGYRNPIETFETNVNGTLNVLTTLEHLSNLKAALIVTTDKVYSDSDKEFGCSESDSLGGNDPYSASKASADILAQAWAKTNPTLPIALARAGNVIGGGDRSSDRLLPDLIRAFSTRESASIRSSGAIRPWQHVMDCLNGYLLLVESMIMQGARGEWNFGPKPKDHVKVQEIVEAASRFWGEGASWTTAPAPVDLVESPTLRLDVSKARNELHFETRMSAEQSVEATVFWEKKILSGTSPLDATRFQVRNFLGAGS